MVITGHSRVYSINQLTGTEFNVILGIVRAADQRCFSEKNEDGTWYSNDDFVLSLSNEERAALAKLGEEIEMMY